MRLPAETCVPPGPQREPGRAPPTLLCNVNFPANTGFAWSHIEGVYARIADHLASHGVRTLVAYPSIPSRPKALEGSAARAVELDVGLETPAAVLRLAHWIRRENVKVLYLSDRHAMHWGYGILRAAGVRRIVVHDHASGAHVAPHGLKRAAKWAAARAPLVTADSIVAVSDFVADRQVRVGLHPRDRIVRIYNGVSVPRPSPGRFALRAMIGAPLERPVIGCACRCVPAKGVAHLLRAFDRLLRVETAPAPRPVLAYVGDGPFLKHVRALRESLASRDDIFLLGYHPEAASLLEGADVCVVPSTWDEAFGLAVVEPMARGKLVIASRVGGIPELITDGVTGMLVPPGDEAALARAMADALADPTRRQSIGSAARLWVQAELDPESKLTEMLALLERGFRLP